MLIEILVFFTHVLYVLEVEFDCLYKTRLVRQIKLYVCVNNRMIYMFVEIIFFGMFLKKFRLNAAMLDIDGILLW